MILDISVLLGFNYRKETTVIVLFYYYTCCLIYIHIHIYINKQRNSVFLHFLRVLNLMTILFVSTQ